MISFIDLCERLVQCLPAAMLLSAAGSVLAAKSVEEWTFPRRVVRRETTLVASGKATGAIVYPAKDGDYKALAERIRRAVEAVTGVSLPVLPDDAVTTEWCGPIKSAYRRKPLVLLGDINKNRATFPLYARYLCECDANYPGKGGRVLRTVFAPYHFTANYIILAGPGRSETAAAVERFVGLVKEHGGKGKLVLPALLDIRLGEEWQELQQRAAREKPVDARKHDVGTMGVAAAAKRCLLTGEAAPAETVRNWFVHHASKPKGFVTSDYQMEAMARGWELTCDSGIYTPEEIHDIETKLLHTLFYQENQYWRRHGPRESLGTRHQAAGSFAFLVLTEVLRRHCADGTDAAAQLDKWIGEVKSYFRSFAERRSYHGERDSNTAFQVMGILFDYAFREGELDIFKNGTARQGIRKAVAVMDSLGFGAGLQNYEDTYPGHVRLCYLVGEPMALAAFYYRDPHLKWLVQNWPGCDFKTWFAHGYGREHAYATDDSLDARPPEGPEYRGFVAAAALGDRLRRNVEAGRATVSYEQAFDKLSLRGAFDPRETYLLIQGMEPLRDWCDDANCIVRMTERGRVCLFHNNKWPSRFHKNGVLVSRGFSTPPPRAARLDLVANFDGAAFSRTTLPAYRGTDWTRLVLWVGGRFTVVFDDVTVREPGECSVTCTWRTPVPAWLDGRRWTSRETGIDFHVVSDAVLPVTTVPEPMVGWEVGLRGSGIRQIQHVQAAKGDVIRFRNLLCTADAGRPAAADLRRLTPKVVVIRDGERYWLAGAGPFSGGKIETDAAAFVVGRTRAFLARATFLRVGGKDLWRSSGRRDAAVALPGEGTGAALPALWSDAENPNLAPSPSAPAGGPLKVAWTYDGFDSPPKAIAGISVKSRAGNPTGLEFIANGEFVHLPEQFARFETAPDLVIDLHGVRTVTGVRIWTRAHAAPRGSVEPDEAIEARITFGDGPDFGSAAERTVALRPGFCFRELYKTQSYVCRFHEVAGLDTRARFVRLRLPETVKQIGELEVLGADKTPPELLDVCAANLDGEPPGEVIVTARTGEVTALTMSGEKLWSRKLSGEPLALAAGDFDGDGPDEVFVSAFDGGLHWFDAGGADHRIAPWPQRFGRLQYDLQFGPAEKGKPRPLYASSYYDVARIRYGSKPESKYLYGMWDYDLLQPTRNLDGKGGADFVVHDIYGRTIAVDTKELEPWCTWSSVPGRLSYWRLVDLRGGKAPGLLVIGWNGLAMYRTEPAANPREVWRREDGARLFCGLVAADAGGRERILVGKADGFVAEFDLDGKLLDCHWIGWPVKTLLQVPRGKNGFHVLVGTDGGLFCFDESWRLRQVLPGPCARLLPVDSDGAIALFLDGRVQKVVPAREE